MPEMRAFTNICYSDYKLMLIPKFGTFARFCFSIHSHIIMYSVYSVAPLYIHKMNIE